MATHPLTPFAYRGWTAPYLAKRPEFCRTAMVVPVRSKTGLAAARNGALVHLDDGIAAVFEAGRAQFAARFLCGGGTTDAEVLHDARPYGGVCERCVDAAAGPCVYRCPSATQVLLYIGSAERWLPRLTNHRTQTPWWPEVDESRIQVTHYRSIFEARAAEIEAIAAEGPLYNKRRTGGGAPGKPNGGRKSRLSPLLQDPQALIAMRVQAGLSPKQLAERAKVSLSHYCQAEKGRCSLSAEYLQRIAGALGAPLNALQNKAYAAQLNQSFAADSPSANEAVGARLSVAFSQAGSGAAE